MGPVVVDACCRGEGVKGIRPPAVREEKSPRWVLIGVDIVVAIVTESVLCQLMLSVSSKRL